MVEKKWVMSNILVSFIVIKNARQSRANNRREARQSWAGEV